MNSDTETPKERMVRAVIDIPESLYNRGKRYFKADKYKGFFLLQSFEAKVNYLEGRDKRLQAERLTADAAYIQTLIDSGEIKIK